MTPRTLEPTTISKGLKEIIFICNIPRQSFHYKSNHNDDYNYYYEYVITIVIYFFAIINEWNDIKMGRRWRVVFTWWYECFQIHLIIIYTTHHYDTISMQTNSLIVIWWKSSPTLTSTDGNLIIFLLLYIKFDQKFELFWFFTVKSRMKKI